MALEGLGDMKTIVEKPVETSRKRRRGRPRSSGAIGENPRVEILDAALKLFNDDGFANTSMTAIARSVNMDQSSLYYWFKSKDQILDEVLTSTFYNCPFRGKLFHADAPFEVRLFSVVYRRVFKYCTLPIDVLDIEYAAANDNGCFRQFFEELELYENSLRSMLEEGMAKGAFINLDLEDAMSLVFSTISNQQHYYHSQLRNRSTLLGIVQPCTALNPEDHALQAARLVTLTLTGARVSIDEVESAARSKGWLEDV